MEEQSNTIHNAKEFVVVMRGPSAVMFHKGENLIAVDFPSSIGPVRITLATRWLNRGEGITVPGHLWIDIRGNGPSLENALVPFANAGLSLLPIVSISANAAIGEPDVEIGFDNTPGIKERDYFQSYIPPETNSLYNARNINVEATVAVLRALDKHPDAERLRRCANQYRLSLDSWRLGRESLALAHLWMALEALTTVKVRTECQGRGLRQPYELAASLGVELKQLDSLIRRDFLLKGDGECYKKAREASDGFEHGYLAYDRVRDLSKDVRHRMAEHVRTAFLELCGIDQNTMKTLAGEPYNKPLGRWPIVKYLRGKLIGDSDELAPKNNAYPLMKWKYTLKNVSVDDKGQLRVKYDETFTAEIAEGIQFRPISYEAWRAE